MHFFGPEIYAVRREREEKTGRTYMQITILMVLSHFGESIICAATHYLTNILWNRRIITKFTRSSPAATILSQIIPVSTTPSYPSRIHLKVSTQLHHGVSPSGFSTNILYVLNFLAVHAICPAHLIILDLITLIILSEEYKSSFLQPHITSSLFITNIILSTLFSNTVSLVFLP
jgi:hypothetical protein